MPSHDDVWRLHSYRPHPLWLSTAERYLLLLFLKILPIPVDPLSLFSFRDVPPRDGKQQS
jgi:hypothetical protein